jgi:hypothetical protein
MTLWRHTKGLRGAAKHLALRDEYSFRKAVDERASKMNIRLFYSHLSPRHAGSNSRDALRGAAYCRRVRSFDSRFNQSRA